MQLLQQAHDKEGTTVGSPDGPPGDGALEQASPSSRRRLPCTSSPARLGTSNRAAYGPRRFKAGLLLQALASALLRSPTNNPARWPVCLPPQPGGNQSLFFLVPLEAEARGKKGSVDGAVRTRCLSLELPGTKPS